MDKKSKILLVVVLVISFLFIGFTFYKTVIKGDFVIRFDVPVRN